MDYEFRRSSRRCTTTGRELASGEVLYSVLFAHGANVERCDFCVEAWQGPPAEALGWWKSRVPRPEAKRIHWAPNEVMLDLFETLDRVPERADFRYLLALLLVRRRVLRLEDTQRDEHGSEVMMMFCPRKGSEHRVPVVLPSPERADAIERELAELLFSTAA